MSSFSGGVEHIVATRGSGWSANIVAGPSNAASGELFAQGWGLDSGDSVFLRQSPVAECGDGRITSPEDCDDGNTESNDGCSSECAIEDGYVCRNMPSMCDVKPTFNNVLLSHLSAGFAHSCALSEDGTLAGCWGDNSFDQSRTVSAQGGPLKAISAGQSHTCAIDAGGLPICWGDIGLCDAPGIQLAQLDAGLDATCGVDLLGGVWCWGRNTAIMGSVPGGQMFTSVTVGHSHACALDVSGQIECWGDNSAGQLEGPAGGATFVQVSAGSRHTCGLTGDGEIVCWGDPSAVGAVVSRGDVLNISAGGAQTCALHADRTVACWGVDVVSPSQSDFVVVDAGQSHGCGLRVDGEVVCWGHNQQGQGLVPTGQGFVSVSVGEAHGCALSGTGEMSCWGEDTAGEATAAQGQFLNVSAGSGFTCATTTDERITCWGVDANNLVDRAPSPPHRGVSSGRTHACAIHATMGVTLRCWGAGNGASNASNPQGNAEFLEVSAGGDHSCAILSDGAIVCWGNISDPAQSEGALHIGAGEAHVCAVYSDNTVQCWGDDTYGQATNPAGGGFTKISAGDTYSCGLVGGVIQCWGLSPVNPPSDSTFVDVDAGQHSFQACAVDASGDLVCWGGSPIFVPAALR